MRSKDNKKIDDILKQFSAQKQLNTGYNKVSIEKFWQEKMGSMINKYTERITLKEDILFVYISSSSLKQELTYSRKKVLELIEKEFGPGYIKDIQIR